MKTLTIRENCRGLSHPEQLFADTNEVPVVCRDKPVARILPAQSKMRVRFLAAFRASQPKQSIPNEVLIREDKDARD